MGEECGGPWEVNQNLEFQDQIKNKIRDLNSGADFADFFFDSYLIQSKVPKSWHWMAPDKIFAKSLTPACFSNFKNLPQNKIKFNSVHPSK